MIQKLIFCLIAIQSTSQNCSQGCLKCGENNQCVVCNQFQLQYALNGTCTKAEISNCQLINSLGQCLFCEGNNYIDANNKCAPVTDSIDNCEQYSSATACSKCSTNRFIENGNCSEAINDQSQIENCEYYSDSSTCSECKTGYYEENNKCHQFPTGQNCHVFSKYNCTSCSEGYVLNRNLASLASKYNLTDMDHIDELIVIIYKLQDDVNIIQNDIQVCQKVTVENCMELDDFDTCKTCNLGFYLTFTKQCMQNPIDEIMNCVKYQNNYKCINCVSNYRLSSLTGDYQNPNECVEIPVNEIKNCSSYQTDLNTVKCTECAQNYYLSNETCQDRKQIDSCQQYENQNNECKQCDSGMVLSNDKQLCVTMIENCLIHDIQSSIDSQTVKCSQCIEGQMQNEDSTKCEAGTIENCLVYSEYQICQTCKNNYYYQNLVCKQNDSLDNCSINNKERQNLCSKCEDGYFHFLIQKQCVSVSLSEIQNCVEYNKPTSNQITSICDLCAPGYDLVSQSCNEIGITNCKSLDQDDKSNCSECFSQQGEYYALGESIDSSNQICLSPFEFMSQCETLTNNTDYITGFQCQVCKDKTIPRKTNDQIVCIKETILNSLKTINQYETFETIQNCVVYHSSRSCVRCDKDYFTVNDGSQCLQQCDYQVIPYYEINFEIQYYNMCVQNSNQEIIQSLSAEIQAQSLISSDFIDVKCNNDNYPVIVDIEDNNNYTNIQLNSDNDWFKDGKHFFVQPAVTCDQNSNIISVNGCKYYYKLGDDQYNCLRCQIGKTLDAKFIDYITDCSKNIENCISSDTDMYRYQNMPIYWEQLYSCHVCKNELVPVLFANFDISDDDPKFIQYQNYHINSEQQFEQNNDNQDDLIQCMSESINNIAKNEILVTNCAAYAVNIINSTKLSIFDNQILNSTLFCTFCKPGFKPEYYYDNSNKVVSSCIKIENCSENSDAVNMCSKCAENYFHEYDSDTQQIKYDICLFGKFQTQQANCLALQDDGNLQRCRVCEKGFHLNEDYICEKLTINKCSNWIQKASKNNYRNPKNMNFIIYEGIDGLGCTSCEDGYKGVIMESIACFQSDFVNSKEDLVFPKQNWEENEEILASNFIDNCLNYLVDKDLSGNFLCSKCMTDFVISSDKKKCYSDNKLQNCIEAENETSCLICNEEFGIQFFNSNKICVENTIDNCHKVKNEGDFEKATCQICNSNYYLNADSQCLLGKVAKCKRYEQNEPLLCSECEDGYMIIDETYLFSQRNYCLKIPTEYKCKTYNVDSTEIVSFTNYQTLVCETCTDAWLQPFDIDEEVIDNICLEFNKIDNCDEYLIDTLLSNTNFSCEQCTTATHYKSESGDQCLPRQITPASCSNYSDEKDQCLDCGSSAFINDSFDKCELNPAGLLGCQIYELPDNADETTAPICKSCDMNYYLDSGICVQIDELMSNCSYYVSRTQCKYCDDGYMISDSPQEESSFTNQCVQTNITNCKDFSGGKCETCNDGFKLENEKCVQNEDSNCAVYKTNTDECLLCNYGTTNYYVFENQCEQVSLVINNCIEYSSQDTCKTCAKQTALSADQKLCESSTDFDQNCEQQVQTNDENCVVCNPGYEFNDDMTECVAYQGDHSIQNGCYFPDNDDDSKCSLCISDYYMNSTFQCQIEQNVTKEFVSIIVMRIVVLLFGLLF